VYYITLHYITLHRNSMSSWRETDVYGIGTGRLRT